MHTEMDFTVGLSCRNRIDLANHSIENVMLQCNYPIIVIDDNSDNLSTFDYIHNDRVCVIYNNYKSGLSSLWNQIVRESKTDYIILASDKIRPKHHDFKLIESELHNGYAVVFTHKGGFFGFNKDILELIGPFDDNFKGGGYEDTDLYNRLFENDLGIYISEETLYLYEVVANWTDSGNAEYYNTKWRESPPILYRLRKSDVEISKKRYEELKVKYYRRWKDSNFKIGAIQQAYARYEKVVEEV